MDDILIALGKMSQSFSGASNGVVNLAFRYFSDDYADFNAACDGYTSGATSTSRTVDGVTYSVYCGTELAKIVKKFLNYQVPEYQKDEYTAPKTESSWKLSFAIENFTI